MLSFGATQAETERYARAVRKVWQELPDGDKILFHQLCCHNRYGPEQLAAQQRITDLITAAMLP